MHGYTRLPVIFTFILLSTIAGPAQNASTPPPGRISLLPNYIHRLGHSIDSLVGHISNEKTGFSVGYDIGNGAGDFSVAGEFRKQAVWRREQTIHGHKVVCVFTKTKKLLIVYPDDEANFIARIRNPQELADMMLMVFTYSPEPRSEVDQK